MNLEHNSKEIKKKCLEATEILEIRDQIIIPLHCLINADIEHWIYLRWSTERKVFLIYHWPLTFVIWISPLSVWYPANTDLKKIVLIVPIAGGTLQYITHINQENEENYQCQTSIYPYVHLMCTLLVLIHLFFTIIFRLSWNHNEFSGLLIPEIIHDKVNPLFCGHPVW